MHTLLNQLHDQRYNILSLAEKYGAQDIRIFGSVARGDNQVNSDVDFLVSFKPGYDLFKQRMPLQDELEKLIGRKIDLVVEHELNMHIRDVVLIEARDII